MYGLNLFLLPNTTHELKAFTIKHDFAQHMKKILSRQDGIFFLLKKFNDYSKLIFLEFMSLREKINEQFTVALKNKNKTLVSTLRLILAAIKERDIANRSGTNKEGVKDPEIVKVLRKMKKQRQDSADLYKKGGRQELQEAENEEIKIIESFLPKQLDEEDTKQICKEMIVSLEVSSIKDMGKIMGALKQKYSDSIDFSKANIIVKGLLNQ